MTLAISGTVLRMRLGLIITSLVWSFMAHAAVRTDGTLKPAQTLTGPQFLVPAELGRQVGPNLFHSFGEFNLATGESATFTGPSSVHNVLARVTGGASTIDGALHCTIPGANFYLVNPAGVVFGPNASLDVQGSFAVTTADYVKLGSDGVFHAAAPDKSALTASAPAAFGFLAKQPPAAITVRSSLTVGMDPQSFPDPANLPPATQLPRMLIVGGDVTLTSGGKLLAPAGKIGIASVASAGHATLDPANGPSVDVSGFTRLGAVTVESGASVQAARGGRDGSAIALAADSLTVTGGSDISVTPEEFNVDGGGISINLTGPLTIQGSTIGTTGFISVAGGISVRAASMKITAGGRIGVTGFLAGSVGDVDLMLTGPLTLQDASSIFVQSGGGQAGGIAIKAASASLTSGSQISIASFGSVAGSINLDLTGPLDLRASTISTAADVEQEASGNTVGGVIIRAASATLADSSRLLVNAAQSGATGPIDLTIAGTLDLHSSSSIAATASGIFPPGKLPVDFPVSSTGGIFLRAAQTLVTGASIHSGGFQGSTASNISIRTGSLIADGAAAEIRMNGLLDAHSGPNIDIRGPAAGARADAVTIRNGATLSADSIDPSGAGGIAIDARRVALSAGGTISANSFRQGAPGTIAITADDVTLSDHATIAASAFRGGAGGLIDITTAALTLAGASSIFSTGGGGTVDNITIHLDATGLISDVFPQKVLRDVFLVSATGTRVQLLQAGNPMPPSLDFDDLTLDNRPQAGVLGALVASDLRAGRFTLQFGPADPTVSATLAGWSMSIGAHVFRSTDTPKSGPQLTSTLRATGDPGLTAGVGGTITLRTDRVSLQPGSSIVTSTLGLDRAGDVAIEAGRIDLTSAAIRSTTAAPGDAGRIELTARQNLTARDSIIEVSAANATGGDVSLTAGSALRLSGTTVNAASGADGGNITLQAGRLILITNQSTVTAQAAGDGGRILLDPPIVVLSNSVINGLSQGMPVQVQIIADNFFKSDSQILTNTQLDFPQTDVSGALITLQAARLTREAQLAADCGLRLGESVSSFIVVGRGAQPPEPGGLSPAIDPHDFNLQNRPPRQ